jgi:hypothetical protein
VEANIIGVDLPFEAVSLMAIVMLLREGVGSPTVVDQLHEVVIFLEADRLDGADILIADHIQSEVSQAVDTRREGMEIVDGEIRIAEHAEEPLLEELLAAVELQEEVEWLDEVEVSQGEEGDLPAAEEEAVIKLRNVKSTFSRSLAKFHRELM